MPRANLTLCKQVHNCPNCKMRTPEGFCIALENTNFIRQCPFYKIGLFERFSREYKEDLRAYKKIHGGEEL